MQASKAMLGLLDLLEESDKMSMLRYKRTILKRKLGSVEGGSAPNSLQDPINRLRL